MDEVEPQKSGISRRTVTKAMAWAVPAIAIAAPAPAFAISGEPPTVTIGQACKLPGNSQAAELCSRVRQLSWPRHLKGVCVPDPHLQRL